MIATIIAITVFTIIMIVTISAFHFPPLSLFVVRSVVLQYVDAKVIKPKLNAVRPNLGHVHDFEALNPA